MNNEPAYKYSIFNIADKGFDRSEFMIKKLDNFVLYLETEDHQKYELLKSKRLPMQTSRWMSSTSSASADSSTPKRSIMSTSSKMDAPLMMQKFKSSFPVWSGMRSCGAIRVSSYTASYEWRGCAALSTTSARASDPDHQRILRAKNN
jgi:hypothetical protein